MAATPNAVQASPFNAPAWALLLTILAIVPQFYVSILWWPFASVLLFAAFVLGIVGLVQGRVIGSVLILLLVLVAGPVMMIIAPMMHLAAYRREHPPGPSSNGLEVPYRAAPITLNSTPVLNTPPPDAFVADVKYSQQAAVAKYPSLSSPNSAMNMSFVRRYKLWAQQKDPRLKSSNWPEVLADDCWNHP